MNHLLKARRGFVKFVLLALVLSFFVLTFADGSEAAKKKKHYDDWRAVAADMALEFNAALDNVSNDKYKDAYNNVNDAYFKYYEVQGV